MKLYLVVNTDNEFISVLPAESKDEARMAAARLLREPLAFLCAERLVDDVFDLRGKLR